MKINVSRSEALRRYILGAGLISAVLFYAPAVPTWLAIAACYPIFTALVQWDPLNAVMDKIVVAMGKPAHGILLKKSSAL